MPTANAIITATRNMNRRPADAAFTAGNNAGDGFDPDGEIEGWELILAADSDDQVAVYLDGDDVVLVGDANGAWAVRVEGVKYSDDLAQEWTNVDDVDTADVARAALAGDKAAQAEVVGFEEQARVFRADRALDDAAEE